MCEVQIQKGLGLLLPYQDRELQQCWYLAWPQCSQNNLGR